MTPPRPLDDIALKAAPTRSCWLPGKTVCVAAVDMQESLPDDWKRQILTTVTDKATHYDLPGGAVSTSRAPSDYVTSYEVVIGDVIEEVLPWLMKLYRGQFLEIVEHVSGEILLPSHNVRAGININTIWKATQRDGYENHLDSNPWTGLLAVDSMKIEDGGELVFTHANEHKEPLRVQAGYLYVFNGRQHLHEVLPLLKARRRSTVPMNFWTPGEEASRPADLDEGLYG
jgi:hypothetical protein